MIDRTTRRSQAEIERLLALDSFGIVGTPPEKDFDDLTALAAHVCDAPMAAVTFVDAERQWVKSRQGVEVSETPRELSFCAHALGVPGLLEVPDARADPRFATHPMVVGNPHLRFYAGAPIVTTDGHSLGTLCVMDLDPRTLTALQRRHLQMLADQVLSQLVLRRRARQFASQLDAHLAADAALREQQRLLSGVLKHTDVLIYAKDVEGRFVMVNRAVEHVTAVDGGLLGHTDHDFFDAEFADEFRRNDRNIMATREWQVFSEDLIHPDGSVHTYRSTKFPLIDDDGEVIGIGGVSTDVTELDAARAAHAEAEQRWRALVEQSPAAVIVIDAAGMISYANPEAVALCGAETADQIQSLPAMDLLPLGESSAAAGHALADEVWSDGPAVRGRRGKLRRLDGAEIAVEFTAKTVNHSGVLTVQLEMRDITAVAAANAALRQSASTDPLTGLLNRRAWDQQVESLLCAERFRGSPVTVAVIDLDNFKAYNDSRGHTAGDALLQRFATSAQAALRRDDVLARWGGEEFILALPGTTIEQAEKMLHRVRRCVPAAQTCSIGYTTYVAGEPLSDAVIRADQALYLAKSRGRNQLSVL
ncbi:diguanylate cyclase domain-containing protein [Mycolicibacterium sp. CR10]|uniref:sensor domain-containing diguanylate cyclase n=1 Tax=Mycolicibacterium sp. CR10 TaxID=2562314 RepID=UPI001F0CF789|nr:diguanylate cyclase [Mycolicibacterium sp. CR10]